MQKQALALGYFFLAMFSLFTSSQGYLQRFSVPLCGAALAAALMGIGFLASAWTPQMIAAGKWLEEMVRLAQQPPVNSHHRTADTPSTH